MAGESKSTVEQELKIKLSRKDLKRVFEAFTAKKDVRKSVARKYRPRAYFDTENLSLYRNDMSLRVQYKDDKKGDARGYEQTVKFELPVDENVARKALLRKECKDATPTQTPDLTLVSDADARERLDPFKGEKLTHIFTAKVKRRYFEIEVGKGKKKGTVEIAFDVGKIVLATGEAQVPLCEIEIEHKGGSAKAIKAVKKKIKALAPSARVQPLSKAQQGSRLFLRQKN